METTKQPFYDWRKGLSSLYNLLVGVHILTAVIAIGPLFIVNTFYKNAKSSEEIKYAKIVTSKISSIIDVGFGLQLLTGLLMGIMNPILFQTLWYNLSIVLFLLIGLYFNTVVKPKSKALINMITIYEANVFQEEYKKLLRNVNFYERIGKGLVLLIIILMIFKL